MNPNLSQTSHPKARLTNALPQQMHGLPHFLIKASIRPAQIRKLSGEVIYAICDATICDTGISFCMPFMHGRDRRLRAERPNGDRA
jgi:hypothetical protein